MRENAPKPNVRCPVCDSENLFWHCAQQMNGRVYEWGKLVTCNQCKTEFNIDNLPGYPPCAMCGGPNDQGEVCEKCAETNDPFPVGDMPGAERTL